MQSEDDSYQADFNEPLSLESQSLEDQPVLKEGKVHTTGQVGPLLSQKRRQLEDDKSLLQEELENFQEMSEKVKNERECLEAE